MQNRLQKLYDLDLGNIECKCGHKYNYIPVFEHLKRVLDIHGKNRVHDVILEVVLTQCQECELIFPINYKAHNSILETLGLKEPEGFKDFMMKIKES